MLEKRCRETDYLLSKNVEQQIYEALQELTKSKSENFANGRLVRNMYDDLIMNQARRVSEIDCPSREDLELITVEDIPPQYASVKSEQRL